MLVTDMIIVICGVIVNVIKMLLSMEMLFSLIEAWYSSTHQWQMVESMVGFGLKEGRCNNSRFIKSQVHTGYICQAGQY